MSNDSSAKTREDLVDELIADYMDLTQSGQAPAKEDFIAAHPEFEEELREFLDDQQFFTARASSLTDPSTDVGNSLQPTQAYGSSEEMEFASGLLEGAGNFQTESAASAGGRVFGDYALLEEIARGGMGIVYRAVQTRLNRSVAVKLIRSGELASGDELQRFHAEARAAASLQHPNIVAIHEVGEHDGQHFFSMDLVEGVNLSEFIRKKPMAVHQAVEILGSIAGAIQYAHEQGTLHRDIKPSNILIDDAGRPHVTDFGLAKQATSDSDLTRTGEILGTPSYMPPEQAMGDLEKISEASDVYSLGAVLYELLTGRPPFRASTAVDTLLLVRDAEVVSPRLLNVSVSRDLETICLKCLEKEPSRRYVSAGDLAEDLRRFSNAETILARPVGDLERTARWCRRNPRVTQLYVLILAAMCLVVFQWVRAESNASLAVIEAGKATKQEEIAVREARRADELRIEEQNTRKRAQLAEQRATAAAREMSRLAESEQQARAEKEKLLYSAQMNIAMQAVERGNMRRASDLIANYGPGTLLADLRGFEWYYLWRLLNEAGSTSMQHGNHVFSVAVTPNSKKLVTGSGSATIQVWNIATGRLLKTMTGHDQSVIAVDISPDGKLICSGSYDKTARLWDLETGELLHTWKDNRHDVVDVKFAPDGETIATGSRDDTVRLYNVSTRKQIELFDEHTDDVTAVAYSPDGGLLASASSDLSIRIRQLSTAETVRTLRRVRRNSATSLAFSPDGVILAAGSTAEGGSIILWDYELATERAMLTGHKGFVESIAFTPDGKQLVSGSRDQSVRFWDMETHEVVDIKHGHAGYVLDVACLPDGSGIVSGSKDGFARSWTTDQNAPADVADVGTGIVALDWSEVNNSVAVGTWGYDVQLFDSAMGNHRTNLSGHSGAVVAVKYSPDESILATASRDGSVILWDPVEDVQLRRFWHPAGKGADLRCLTFSPDGEVIAVGDDDGNIHFWNVDDGELVRSLVQKNRSGKPESVSKVAFHPDGTQLYSTGRYLYIFDLETGKQTYRGGHVSTVKSIAVSPVGEYLVTGSRDETIRVQSYQRRKLFSRLEGHSNVVSSMAFMPNGRHLVSGSYDRTVRIWDIETATERAILPSHASEVNAITVSDDGNTIVSGTQQGKLHFWRAASEETVVSASETQLIQSKVINSSRSVELIRQMRGTMRYFGTPDGPVVEAVQLRGNIVNDDSLTALHSLTRLRELSLFNTGVVGRGLGYIKHRDVLETLHLIGVRLADHGVSSISLFPNLKELSLGMGIQPEDAPWVSLVTDATMNHVSKLSNLESITLDNTGVTDIGLYRLRKIPSLKRVQVFRTPGVTSAGLILLRVALPDCEISGDIEDVDTKSSAR